MNTQIMRAPADRASLELRSLLKETGELELSLAAVRTPECRDGEVLVRVLAAPVNPTDIIMMFGPADIGSAQVSPGSDGARVVFQLPPEAVRAMAGRVGKPLPIGREGAGVVVEAGASPGAQVLLGKTVAVLGEGMFSTYRQVRVDQCLALPDGTRAAQGASSFINPLTALGMVETMRREGHGALVHTAAASNLGQMLLRICLQDGVELVCVVRKREQAELLQAMGAAWVCDSSSPGFRQDLEDAVAATGATIAFDATGGGPLAGLILSAMEASSKKKAGSPNPGVRKQVYQYGRLDPNPTTYRNDFGFDWQIGGWDVFSFMKRAGPQAVAQLKQRVLRDLGSTFASRYSREISLSDLLRPEVMRDYHRQATGEKFLVNLDPSS